MSDTLKTRQIIELLNHKHSGKGEWATFAELATGTGARSHRYIDFFAFNLWPSKNYHRVAYEVKVSRADFARELKKPEKRSYAERYANECFFVTPVGLVKPDEVPAGWGLIELVKNGLRTKKHAQQRESQDLPIEFMATMARRSSDPAPTLPKALWLLAGQEVSDTDALREAAAAAVVRQAKREVRQRVQEARDESREEIAKLQRYTRIIRTQLSPGWNLISPEEFEAWIFKQKMVGSGGLSPQLRDRIRQVESDLAAILEMTGESA